MISNDDKVALILKDLASNYNTFLKQSKTKLYKHKQLCDPDSHKELVSDVLFSVIQKLNNDKDIDRFFKMASSNKLSLYVLKAISTNSSFYSAPFLQKKIKEHNRLKIFEDHKYFEENSEEIAQEEAIQMAIITDIKSMLEKPRAPLIFGEDWYYYTTLFKEYVSSDVSYKGLAEKYDIPKSSIAFHIRIVKDKIRAELKKTGLNS